MAKENKRGNRESKKPKQIKTVPAVPAVFEKGSFPPATLPKKKKA